MKWSAKIPNNRKDKIHKITQTKTQESQLEIMHDKYQLE